MEWFKHKTASLDDPDIQELMDEFGDSGYMMFFGILEIYGREYKDTDPNGYLSINLAFVARKLRKSQAKVRKFLGYCQGIGRFNHSIEGKKVLIQIPAFIDISSNWTKREASLPTEAPTEAPQAKEVEVEEDKEEDKRKKPKKGNSYTEQFVQFYAAYPNKTAKAAAFKEWKKINGKAELLPIMISAIKAQKEDKDRRLESGAFCPEWPNPSTWLHQQRWEDEIQEARGTLKADGSYASLPRNESGETEFVQRMNEEEEKERQANG